MKTLDKPGVQFPIWIKQIGAIAQADLRKLRRDPTELFTRMLQPLIWILIFGEAVARTKILITGSYSYLDYMVPGILAQSILFISIYYGLEAIWEKDIGILHKILVTPVPRTALVFARTLSAGVRGLCQIVMIYVVAAFLKIDLKWDFLTLCGIVVVSYMIAGIFSTFSLILASLVKRRDRFMGIGQAITMPLFFASNALYPLDAMPKTIKALSLANPLTYQVDAIRTFMIEGHVSHFGLGIDFLVSIVTFVAMILIASWVYPKLIY